MKKIIKQIKPSAEISEIKTKSKELKSWFLEKIYKIDKPLVNLTKIYREKIQTEKIIDERRHCNWYQKS